MTNFELSCKIMASESTQVVQNTSKEQEEFHFSDGHTLEQLRSLQAEFVKERDWDQYHTPRNLVLAMVGEVGELAEIFQWKGEVKDGLPDFTEKEKVHVAQELSDILIYLMRVADKCHVDLPKAALEKMALNAKKYPADLVRGSCKNTQNINNLAMGSLGDKTLDNGGK